MSSVPLKWLVGHHKSRDERPEQWAEARVPGAVQLDWAQAQGWGPHYVGDAFRQYEWMEDVYWTYTAKFPTVDLKPSERLVFHCGGVDYACDVLLNGALLHRQEGMLTPIDLDLTEAAGRGGELAIRIDPAPKSAARPSRDQANRSCKPAVSYGWDFHPRLIPLGIWQETALTVRPAGYIRSAELTYTLSKGLDRADLGLAVSFAGGDDGRVRWTVLDPGGNPLATQKGGSELKLAIDRPLLWWPHDHGDQPLYTSVVERLSPAGEVLERREKRFGLRRARLVVHEGGWTKPDEFPKSRSNPPITLEINGRVVFVKGCNFMTPDIFPGTLDRHRYQQLLRAVRTGNLGMVRMWGGAPAQKEPFYELCDELGIMVWQEFPLACNHYPDDPAYLAVLDQESRSLIRRLREHPSLVMWCGGNELFNSWSGMTDQSHPLRLLNANCYELDRHTPFLPTSPVMGMGHGHYTFADLANGGVEGTQIIQRATCTAYTEFGVPGPASVEVLKTFLGEDEQFPPRPGTSWETHHAFGAWMPGSHLHLDVIEHYFGPQPSLEAVVANGQLLQAEGYKGMFEEARRQKPHASMALNWVFNEPWPTAANLSLVSWPCVPKPSLAAVAAACRPVLASARFDKFLWKAGELFTAELWMLNDTYAAVPPGEVKAMLVGDGVEIPLLAWPHGEVPANRNLRGPRAQCALPELGGDRFELRLIASDGRHSSSYTFAFRPTMAEPKRRKPVMNLG